MRRIVVRTSLCGSTGEPAPPERKTQGAHLSQTWAAVLAWGISCLAAAGIIALMIWGAHKDDED